MMRTQDHKHVIPESQEYNSQFANKFPNLSEVGRMDTSHEQNSHSNETHVQANRDEESHKYASRYRPATQQEIYEDMRPDMPPEMSSPTYVPRGRSEASRVFNMSTADQERNTDQRYRKPHDPYSRPTMESMQANPNAINIYAINKYVKVKFLNPDNLFQSYSIFRQQCQPYGVYLNEISLITHKESSMCPDQFNGNKIDAAHKEAMSNVIYDYLYDEKHVPLSYQTARAALKRCGQKLDGYSVLFQMLAETHPRIATQDVTNVAPLYHECKDLDEFTNKFENFFLCEKLDSRTYTPRQKLVLFMKALPNEFEKALMRINAILDTTGKDQEIPPDLDVSRLSVTLTKYMREAGVSIPPGLVETKEDGESIGARVSKADLKTRNESPRDNKFRRPPRKQMVDSFCKGCGQYGHEIDQCVVVAKHICVGRWIEKADKESKQSVMKSYRQKQQETKEKYLKQAVRSLQKTLEKGENDPAAQLVESHLVRLMSGSAQSQLPFEVSDSDTSDDDESVSESVVDEE